MREPTDLEIHNELLFSKIESDIRYAPAPPRRL